MEEREKGTDGDKNKYKKKKEIQKKYYLLCLLLSLQLSHILFQAIPSSLPLN